MINTIRTKNNDRREHDSVTGALNHGPCRKGFSAGLLLLAITLGTFFLPGDSIGEPKRGLTEKAAKILSSDSSFVLIDIESGAVLADRNGSKPLKPASVLKILTTAVALRELGPEFRFETDLLLQRGKKAEDLIVRGGGDPSLTIEAAWLMARRLKLIGLSEINDLILDDSGFRETRKPLGQRSYETGPSALSFNFNSISFEVCPTGPGRPATVRVDPFEFPVRLEGTIQTKGQGSRHGFAIDQTGGPGPSYRLSGSISLSQGCETFYRSVYDIPSYFGETFKSILQSVGISVRGEVRQGRAGPNATIVHTHRSKPLRLILEDLNHFSNNFIAEQVLYLLGKRGAQMDRSAGLERLVAYLQETGNGSGSVIEDASGLSHANRVSAAAFAQILATMEKDIGVGSEFVNSLSVSGRNGTLKRRSFSVMPGAIRGKTGTLDGVSSLAGYVFDRSGRKYAFVIIQNNVDSRDSAIQAENRLIEEILG